MKNYTYNDEIYHAGVKGMKWRFKRIGKYVHKDMMAYDPEGDKYSKDVFNDVTNAAGSTEKRKRKRRGSLYKRRRGRKRFGARILRK